MGSDETIGEHESAGRIRRVAFGAFAGWQAPIRQTLPPRYEPNFVDLSSTALDAFDVVVPLMRTDYRALETRPDLRGKKFWFPTEAADTLCNDKRRLTEFLIEQGLGEFTPPLRDPGPPYPYIWKKRTGGFGLHCFIVNGPQDEQRPELSDQAWFAQTLVCDPIEYATHMLRAGGRLYYYSTFTFDMGAPATVRGQNAAAVDAHFVRGAPFLPLLQSILERLDYEGTACFNYKIVDGRPLIFEINPRFGASLTADVTLYLDRYCAALGLPDLAARP